MSARMVTQLQLCGKEFADQMRVLDRALRNRRDPIPPAEDRAAVASAIFRLESAAREITGGQPASRSRPAQQALMLSAGPWLWRQDVLQRAWFKPHGIPGDYRLLEMIYELEGAVGSDPGRTATINALDAAISQWHVVSSFRRRRRWMAAVVQHVLTEHPGQVVRVLDLGCGGARHMLDVLTQEEDERLRLLLVDRDAACIGFVQQRFARWANRIQALCQFPEKLPKQLTGKERFEIIFASGLVEALPHAAARRVLQALSAFLAPGGRIAIASMHPDNPSAFGLDWLADWQLPHYSEEELAALFPPSWSVHLSRKADPALIRAEGWP